MFGRQREQADPVEPLDLLPYVALPQRHVDHRRLDVGMAHGLRDGEGVGTAMAIWDPKVWRKPWI
jgi:hypothetical protein